jgi:hypothetical protein
VISEYYWKIPDEDLPFLCMHECSVWGNVLQQDGVQLHTANEILDILNEHFGDPNHYKTISKTYV